MASSFPNAKDSFTTVVDAVSGDADSGIDVDATLLNAYKEAHEAMQDTIGLNTGNALLGGYGDLAAYLTARFATLLDLDTDYLVEHNEDGSHGNTKKLRCEVVADATARAAISSPVEGNLVWQSDTDMFYVYDGAAWDVVPGAGHNVLGTRHSDSVTDAVTQGSIIYGNATPKWDELVIGAASTYLRSDGTDVSWGVLADHDHTGDAGDGAQISHDTALTGVSIDDHHARDHKARHERAGADEVDGDHLGIDYTPTHYVPATTPAEAANVDDLTAHLYGVDVVAGKYKTLTKFLDASMLRPATTNGCAAKATTEYGTHDVDIDTLGFDKTADEFAQWTGVLDNWDAGTITGTWYWTFGAGGSAAETIMFKLDGRAYANDDAFDQAWGTAVQRSDVAIAIGDTHISAATAACTLAGTPAAGQLIQLRVWRDVSGDDLDCDADLVGVLITYTRALS